MLFGSSGIRQEFGPGLVELALRIGAATAAGASMIVVGRDTRMTSELLEHSVVAGMLSAGATVYSCGIAPTPTVAHATGCVDAGCMITASHNLDLVSLERPVAAVLDCGNGAGSVITPDLLAGAGAAVIGLNCNVAGKFARPSEPLEANLPYIGEIVRRREAACAVIHDGDADRMMAFDERGRYIDGDHLLMLFAKYLDRKRVVTTVDASMAIEEVAEVRRTPVGDSFVSEELLSWGDFGGEASGSWIFPEHSYCPDGVYAAALLCEIASEWSIAEELDRMPRYTLLRESYRIGSPQEVMVAMGADESTHGIRFEDEDGWYLIRASGTEPKVRITAEGRTPAKAKEMLGLGHAALERANRILE